MWKKMVLVLGVLVYAVVLVLVLLVIRFPREALLEAVAGQLEQVLPGYDCSVAAATYVFPLSVHFSNIRIIGRRQGVDVAINTAAVRLDNQHPFSRGKFSFTVRGAAVTGELEVNRSRKMLKLPLLSIKGVDIGALGLASRLDRNISGSADFLGSFQAPLTEPVKGTVAGKLLVRDARFVLRRPILTEQLLQFATIETGISATAESVLLSNGEAVGPAYRGHFSGEVRLVVPWWNSELTVVGDVLPEPSYLRQNRRLERTVALLGDIYGSGPVPCTVTGTLTSPVFHFGMDQRR